MSEVVDLLAPYAKGGKIGLFGGAGVGKTVRATGVDRPVDFAKRKACIDWLSHDDGEGASKKHS